MRRSSTCHFIHPSDPEWSDSDNRRSARDYSPRRSPASSSSYQGYETRRSPSTDRQRAAPESALKRRRTPPRGSSVHYPDRKPDHQPRSPRRGDSPPRGRGSFSTTGDDRPLPHPSSSHDRRDSHPQPDLASSKDASKSSIPEMGNWSIRRPLSSLKSPVLATAAATPMASTSTMPTDSAKVPSRSFSDILPPPPSLNSASLKDEMTPEQRRAVWEKRVA